MANELTDEEFLGAPATSQGIDTSGGWEKINLSYKGKSEELERGRMEILQQELAEEKDPENQARLQREIGRMKVPAVVPSPAAASQASEMTDDEFLGKVPAPVAPAAPAGAGLVSPFKRFGELETKAGKDIEAAWSAAIKSPGGKTILNAALSTLGGAFMPLQDAIQAFGVEPVLGKGKAAEEVAMGLSMATPLLGLSKTLSAGAGTVGKAVLGMGEAAVPKAGLGNRAGYQAAAEAAGKEEAAILGKIVPEGKPLKSFIDEATGVVPPPRTDLGNRPLTGEAAKAAQRAATRAAFKSEPEYANWLKADADRQAGLRKLTEEQAQFAQKAEEAAIQMEKAQAALPRAPFQSIISSREAASIVEKPAFERSAIDRLRLKQFEKQRGEVNPILLARLAAAGLGGVAGSLADEEHPILGAALGAVAGLGGAAIPYGKALAGMKKALDADERIRITGMADQWEHMLARRSREVWQLQGRIEKLVPELLGRTKITHWLDGDKSIVLTQKEMEAAKEARTFLDAMKEAGKESGVLDGTLNDYIAHLWKKDAGEFENGVAKAGMNMSTTSRFALERGLTTIKEGKAAGFVPVTEDVSQILGIYGNSMGRSVENKKLMTALKEANVRGVQLVKSADKAPMNYVAIQHPQWGGLRVHPDIAPSLAHMFDSKTPGAMKNALLAVNLATKRIAVSTSLFHAKALLDASIGAGMNPLKAIPMTLGRGVPGLEKVFPKTLGENPYLKMLRDGGAGDLVDDAHKAGLKISYERATPIVEDIGGNFYTSLQGVQRVLDSTLPGLGLGKGVEGFSKLNHKFDNFMWGRLHSGMKLEIFAKETERLLQKHPSLGKDEAGRIAASYTNDIFGGLNWRRIAEGAQTKYGRDFLLRTLNPSGRQDLQILAFAPDWTLSTTRAMAKGLGGGLKGTDLSKLHRMYTLRSAVYYGIIGDGINYALSGHHIWENKDPTVVDMGDGRTMQFSKHAMEPVHWITQPGRQAMGKMGWAPKALVDSASSIRRTGGIDPLASTKYLGKSLLPIWAQGIGDKPAGQTALGLAGIPIMGKTDEQRIQDRIEQSRKRAERERDPAYQKKQREKQEELRGRK